MPHLYRITDGTGDSGAMSIAYKVDEHGKMIEMGNRPKVGCYMRVGSVTARSYSFQDYWTTTLVTEIIEEREDYVKFKTGNSVYEWRL